MKPADSQHRPIWQTTVTTTIYETEQQLSSTVFHYLSGTIPDTGCKPYASKLEKHKAWKILGILKKFPWARTGENVWERVPKLFMNLEEILSCAYGNFEE
jgi:hypothetical protein